MKKKKPTLCLGPCDDSLSGALELGITGKKNGAINI